jgi:NADH-quinone oxidoreductase subunit L
MFGFLWIIIALPFAGFLALAIFGNRIKKSAAAIVGVGATAMSALIALGIGACFFIGPPAGHGYTQVLWTWVPVAPLMSAFSFRLDGLSLIMTLVILIVASLILLYSSESMVEEEGYSRFFASMNLFVGCMLVLVLANDLLLLYLGWEGVGLCSYLLIGFHYKDPDSIRASKKAFIVTRIGDVAFMVGLFLIVKNLGTLQIPDALQKAGALWPAGSALPCAAALLLLAGAIGKSAQIPLQVWLPDAMAGPTPVSALIHAATMVIAGVYLIARMHGIFLLSPAVMGLTACIGAATLLAAGCAALMQRDIKRVLAYSTISQIGYMFLALGVGAFSAAIFHFLVHAFFKSLLFLAAGVVIQSCNEEHDIFNMGGLRHALPWAFWAFLIGSCSLSALPLVSAGFYSKDLIIFSAWSSSLGNGWLWLCAEAGALITALYSFRVVFIVFFGTQRRISPKKTGLRVNLPLAALSFFAIFAGFMQASLPHSANEGFFSILLGAILPAPALKDIAPPARMTLHLLSPAASLGGIFIAWVLFLRNPRIVQGLARTFAGRILNTFFLEGLWFDRTYSFMFARPFAWAARLVRGDPLLFYVKVFTAGGRGLHKALSSTQTGNVRWYAAGIALGAVIAMAIGVLL